MIVLGDEKIDTKSIVYSSNFQDVKNSSPNDIIKLNYDVGYLKQLVSNDIECIVQVENIQDLIYANILKATYILVHKNIAKQAQNIADDYMFDSKILVAISSKEEIEKIAYDAIDGVLFIKDIATSLV
ncbi:MAG: hypothetical protein DRG11_04505 [Epsilonproteobacteria bacterium]|nr:MAG: hypothetical protein DRG11_04505 [Campylobacterota bacterium]